jgi:hypothetical protein
MPTNLFFVQSHGGVDPIVFHLIEKAHFDARMADQNDQRQHAIHAY